MTTAWNLINTVDSQTSSGGTVLTRLATPENMKRLAVSVLVRKPEQAEAYSANGFNPILFQDLKDAAFLRRIAADYDLVIHTADSTNPEAVEAFIQGLADRTKKTGRRSHFMHLSGTSSLGDNPITKPALESHEFSDEEDIYAYLKFRETTDTYSQRVTDIRAVEAGKQAGVETHIIKAPRIFGRGTGLFNQKSAHIPWLIAGALSAGQAEYIGDGAGVWDDVHVADLADLFAIVLDEILEEKAVVPELGGIYFAATQRHSWKELAQGIASAGVELGRLETASPMQISLEAAAAKYTGGDVLTAEVGLAST